MARCTPPEHRVDDVALAFLDAAGWNTKGFVEESTIRPTFQVVTAVIALFGIAWLANTFIEAHLEAIVAVLGDAVEAVPLGFRARDLHCCGTHHKPVSHHEHGGTADRARPRNPRGGTDHRDVAGARGRLLPARERQSARVCRAGPNGLDEGSASTLSTTRSWFRCLCAQPYRCSPAWRFRPLSSR